MTKNEFESMTALVIDDEHMMRVLLKGLLHEIGFSNIMETEDGADGLAQIETIPTIDIIICDLEMPIIGGLEFVGMLRASKVAFNPKVPVLIVSGHSEQKNIHEAVRMGINGFLVKPVSRKALENRISYALKHTIIDNTNLTPKKRTMPVVEVLDFNKK
ncbi:MAG: response regulator [Rhodospirillales bacterium]|nr:response regulator [Rhodospirillales bacterium]